MRIGYAGDRQISVDILSYILSQNVHPLVLIISDKKTASHSQELINLCNLISDNIIKGSDIRNNVDKIKNLNLDYLICIHFPFIIPKEILASVKIGVLNLHPAYLPYNRGWHTSTWSILNNTPYGSTLHFMDEHIDTGDIINQREIIKLPTDTGDTLYKKALKLEVDIFKESWPHLVNNTIIRKPQNSLEGTNHTKRDIAPFREIDMNSTIKIKDFITILKACTTNLYEDSAYFIQDGKKYYVQIKITDSET